MLYDQCFAIVVGLEGKLSIDPRDPGNWRGNTLVGTKYGVCARDNPDVDILNLTLEDAKAIHKARSWAPAGCDLLPAKAALCAFDCSVNQGWPTAVRLMQTACGIGADGELGPQTRATWPRVTTVQLARFMGLRAVRYVHTKGFDVDGDGWETRLFTVALAELTA